MVTPRCGPGWPGSVFVNGLPAPCGRASGALRVSVTRPSTGTVVVPVLSGAVVCAAAVTKTASPSPYEAGNGPATAAPSPKPSR